MSGSKHQTDMLPNKERVAPLSSSFGRFRLHVLEETAAEAEEADPRFAKVIV